MSSVLRPLIGVALFLAVIQFFRPARVNVPEVPNQTLQHNTILPAEVASILKRSCADCHSNQTQWPWYSGVAPFSWVVVDDVVRGRLALNFSEWAGYEPEEARSRLESICEEVEMGWMPPFSYRLLHSRARLTSGEISQLCRWTETERRRIR